MWQDNISKKDMLGFDLHARIIIALLQEQKMLPLTLGVFGDWGSGKSSILEKIYEELKTKSFQDKGIFTIQFNGWTFEGYDDAKAALMEAIVKKIEDEFKTIEEVKSVAKRLYKSINWMRVAKVTVPIATAYFTGGASIIPQIISNLKEFKDAPQKIEALNKRLKAYAKAHRIPFVDYYSQMVKEDSKALIPEYTKDGVHPTVEGYKVMESLIKPVIDKALH